MSEFDSLSCETNYEEVERHGFRSSRQVSSLLENLNDYFAESMGFRRHHLRRYPTVPLLMHIVDDEDEQAKKIGRGAAVAGVPWMPSDGHFGDGGGRVQSAEEDSALQTSAHRFYSESSSSVAGGASSTDDESIQTPGISCSNRNFVDIFSCSPYRISSFSRASSSSFSSSLPAIDAVHSLYPQVKSASSTTNGIVGRRKASGWKQTPNDEDQREEGPQFSPRELAIRSLSMPKLWATSTDIGGVSGTTQEEKSLISRPTVIKVSDTKQLVIFTMERCLRQKRSNEDDDISLTTTVNRYSS